jgi:hypothetical protein
MKRTSLALALFLLAVSAIAADGLPSNLVGVWTTDGSVLNAGARLLKGKALYLGADGIGAAVVAPPPLGHKIVATYDAKTNVITFERVERGKIVGSGTVVYDPTKKTISSDRPKDTFPRRLDQFSNETRKAMGLEATPE